MQKRLSALIFLVLFLFFLLSLYLLTLSQNTVYPALSAANAKRTVTLYQTRGQIYDRNYIPLCEGKEVYSVIFGADDTQILPGIVNTPLSATFLMPTRQAVAAPHIIGYLSDGVGISGIEAAMEQTLTANRQSAKASISILGNGDTAPTASVSLHLPPPTSDGVVLTLDKELQTALESAMQGIDKGAAVCIDAETGEILAICSKPTFSDPAEALNASDAPLYNRALAAYPVGSVIKPFIAAAALEQGYSPEMGIRCTGQVMIGKVRFRCHERSGHGILNLYGAIQHSCNPYFIDLASRFPVENTLQTLRSFGFGEGITLASTIRSASGVLPNSLTPGELANLSFGQGALTATPLQICAAYAALANGGIYRTPTLIHGTTSDGETLIPSAKPIERTVLSAKTASILADALYQTVMESASSLAKPATGIVSGKTGTAQTGRYRDGEELLIGWFAGWFTAEKTQKTVAITVLCEDADSGNVSAAPVVREVYEIFTVE